MAFFRKSHDNFDSTFKTTKTGIAVAAGGCNHDLFGVKVSPEFNLSQKKGNLTGDVTFNLPHDSSLKYDCKTITATTKAKVDSVKVKCTAKADKKGGDAHAVLAFDATPFSSASTKVEATLFKGDDTAKVTHEYLVKLTDNMHASAAAQHVARGSAISTKFLGVGATFTHGSFQGEISSDLQNVTASAVTKASIFNKDLTIGAKAVVTTDLKLSSHTFGVVSPCTGGKTTVALENFNTLRIGFKNKSKVAFGYTADLSAGLCEPEHSIGVKVTL